MIDQINDEAIDREFARMAHDRQYHEEARRLSSEFARADRGAFKAGEARVSVSETPAGTRGSPANRAV